jgi:hypothetical protein
MRHLFILFSGYILWPRSIAIRDRTILFESSFKFFFAHTSSLSLSMGTVAAKAERVVTFLGGNKREPANSTAQNEKGEIEGEIGKERRKGVQPSLFAQAHE